MQLVKPNWLPLYQLALQYFCWSASSVMCGVRVFGRCSGVAFRLNLYSLGRKNASHGCPILNPSAGGRAGERPSLPELEAVYWHRTAVWKTPSVNFIQIKNVDDLNRALAQAKANRSCSISTPTGAWLQEFENTPSASGIFSSYAAVADTICSRRYRQQRAG